MMDSLENKPLLSYIKGTVTAGLEKNPVTFQESCYILSNMAIQEPVQPSLKKEKDALKNELAVRSMKRLSCREKVKNLLQLFKKDDRVLVVIVSDPDSMASAFALQRLLRRRVEALAIAHPNEMKRVNNIAMKELLKIPLERLRNIKKEHFTKFVLLDSQPHHLPELSQFSYDVVIDHHPVTEGWSASFVDIRPEYGATATMLAEYLKAAKIEPSVHLATALFYAIKTDTLNFTKKAIAADVLCFQNLFKRINQQLLNKIESSTIRKSELKYFKAAFANLVVHENRIYCHIERLPNPDLLVVIADFLTCVHEVGWVIVSGRCADKLVVILRCDGYKKDAGKLAQKLFQHIGSAGGHKQRARAEIPWENLPEKLSNRFTTSTLRRLVTEHLDK
jgi:nanoRNase/pAp phosphatase (c-di-AMP/oligoRNAs hydrolase)